MSRVTVRVKRDHLTHALQQTSTQCAVAMAIKDLDPDGNYSRPRVTQDTITFTNERDGKRYTFPTPKNVATFIDKFDKGQLTPEETRPFTFTLDTEQAEVKPRRHTSPVQSYKQAVRQRERRERGVYSQTREARSFRAIRPSAND